MSRELEFITVYLSLTRFRKIKIFSYNNDFYIISYAF